MTILPNMGLVLPTRGAPGAGLWDDTVDANYALEDAHDHTTGKGLPITSAAIEIDADVTFSSLWAPTNLHRIQFASVTALAANNKSIFVNAADNELYWRSNAGSNVKLTVGAALNVAAFTGGIGGDYAAVGAAVAFDDSGDRYTFKQQGGTWARMASGAVRIFETGSTDSVFVGLEAPAALASSFTLTLPLALPGSTAIAQVDSSGVMTTSNTIVNDVVMTANKHVTVSGTGEFKHGDRQLSLGPHLYQVASGTGSLAFSNVSFAANGSVMLSIPLIAGDRIRSYTIGIFGDGTSDITCEFVKLSATNVQTIVDTTVITNAPGSYVVTPVNPADQTVAAGEFYMISYSVVNITTNCFLGATTVTYDHP